MDETRPESVPCDWSQSERMLARTFESWRAEFRNILEDHRREIQARLEKIEHEIEKKSDKENVDLLVRNIQDDLRRHADDIKSLQAGINEKMGVETMWKWSVLCSPSAARAASWLPGSRSDGNKQVRPQTT